MTNDNFKKFIFDFKTLDKCPLCLSPVFIPAGKFKWLSNEFRYVLCPVCGLKYMNPRPTQESYDAFYKNLFWQQKIRNIGFKQSEQIWQEQKYKLDTGKKWDPKFGTKNRKIKQSEQRSNKIIPILSKHFTINKSSNILEVGCSFGVTLHNLYKRFGCQVYGIEPSIEARKSIKDYGTIELLGYFAKDLKKVCKKEPKFDAIIFSHILENIIDPLQILNYAKQCLKEKGVLYIETPNLLIFDAMNPYHPYIFSKHSLILMIKKVGFEPEVISKKLDRMLTVICKT